MAGGRFRLNCSLLRGGNVLFSGDNCLGTDKLLSRGGNVLLIVSPGSYNINKHVQVCCSSISNTDITNMDPYHLNDARDVKRPTKK